VGEGIAYRTLVGLVSTSTTSQTGSRAERVRRWEHRLDPVQTRLFGGCHLTRPIVELLTTAGFTISELLVFYETGAPKPMGGDSLGIASSP
jgi:hypothetical protein